MKIYIVGRPVEEMKMFLPVYITTHKDKAKTFVSYYSDESIMLMIFSKEWTPEDNNLFFGYFEEDEMCKKNTLYGIWDKWMDMSEEESQLYISGDPNEELDENGMMTVKIWEL